MPTRRLFIVNRFFSPDLSATSQIASDLGFELAARGKDVIAVASRYLYEGGAQLPPKSTEQGVEIRRLRTTNFGRAHPIGRGIDYLTFHILVFVHLLRHLHAGDVVIAKTDPPLISVIVALAARLKRAVLINWLQDLFPEVAGSMLPGIVVRGLRALRDWSLKRAHANIVIGALMAEHVANAGVDPRAIVKIPNWADDDIHPVPPGSNDLRSQWGYAPSQTVVAYSGNLGFAHDYETMLAAAKTLAEDTDIQFLVIGGGNGARKLQAAATVADLRNIQFEPYQPRSILSLSLSVGDVHWLSLRPDMEGLIVPSKLYGILSAGRPFLFVGDADGEVGRFVAEHGGGVVVAEGDDKAFAQAVRTFHNDRAMQADMAAAALRAGALYSKRAAVKRWMELLPGD